MSKYIALLRGVNVNGRIVKSAELKDCFHKLGFENISTILQTGNVIFETSTSNKSELKTKIESGLTKTFSYPATIFLYSAQELAGYIKNYPFKIKPDFHSYVVFLGDNIAKELVEKCGELDSKIEQIAAGNAVIYWQVQKGMTLKSDFARRLGKTKYKNTTTRNLNTLNKIV